MLLRVEEGGRSKRSVTLMSSVVINQSETLIETSLTGQLLLDNPLLNKGSAFSQDERREFALLGLLPVHSSTVEEQLARTPRTAQITQKESA